MVSPRCPWEARSTVCTRRRSETCTWEGAVCEETSRGASLQAGLLTHISPPLHPLDGTRTLQMVAEERFFKGTNMATSLLKTVTEIEKNTLRLETVLIWEKKKKKS